MAHVGETLRGLLDNPELKEVLADVFFTGIDSSSQFHKISLADHIRHARGIDVSETPFEELPDKLDDAMQSLVIDRLPQPAPVTLEDLTELAIAHLAGIDLLRVKEDENIERTYARFVTCAGLEVEQERHNSDLHSLGDEWGLPEQGSPLANHLCNLGGVESNSMPPSVYTSAEIWRSPSGFSFDCLINGYCEDSCEQVYGKLSGYCTQRALQHVESQFEGLVSSIAKTSELCAHDPPISFLTDGDGQQVFAGCLSAICHLPGTNGSTILDRLRNAVILLSHADSTKADPISLSFSFAAIEALMCEKDEVAVNKQIKRHVSTLLVKDIAEREKRAKVLSKLYEIRCQVMHGSQVIASYQATECVRRIAAGVVRGVINWTKSQERIGGDTSWKEFMDEINAASRKPGEVVGVPDLSGLIPDKVPT